MLKVLIVDDDIDYLDELKCEVFEECKDQLDLREAHNGETAIRLIKRFRPDLLVVDMIFPMETDGYPVIDAGVQVIDKIQEELPQCHVVALSSRERDFAVKLLTSRRIADFLFKDLSWKEISTRLLNHIDVTKTQKKTALLSEQVAHEEQRQFMAKDPLTLELLRKAGKVAPTEATVLLLGESGTGKEVLARRIHENSNRKDSAFIAVNCGALDENLVGSELFGHVKGAFTGADQARRGKFELAHGGTLFLDEVGELSLNNQVRLLRVLEERTFERVGSTETIECDVRLIAATNRNVEGMVAEGTFREDLYFRLAVFSIELPPLRQRKEDIILLTKYVLSKFSSSRGKEINSISKDAAKTLMSYQWPGNVRQLRNAIEHAVIIEQSNTLSASSLPPLASRPASVQQDSLFQAGQTYREAFNEYESQYLAEVLRHFKGNTKEAASALDIPLRTLQSRLKRLKMKAQDYR